MADGDDYSPLKEQVTTGQSAPPVTPSSTYSPLHPDQPDQGSLLNDSWWDVGKRRFGLGLRDVAEGVGSLVGGVGDVLTYPGRALGHAIGYEPPPGSDYYVRPSEQIKSWIDSTGLPKPETSSEKTTSTVTQGAAGNLPFGAASLPAAIISAGSGGAGALTGDWLANQTWVPEALKPTARLIGNVAGGVGVAKLGQSLETLSNAVQGVPSLIAAAYDRLGITPRTADIGGGATTRSLTAYASRAPGSAGTVQDASRQVVDDFSNAVDNTAARLHPGVASAADADALSEAGKVAQASARDWRYNQFQQLQDRAFAPVNRTMAGQPVDPSGYRSALQDAAVDPRLAGLPETQRAYAQQRIQTLLDAINKDAPPGKMLTWEQAQGLRRQAGDMLTTPEIVNSIGSTNASSIYGGIADDLQNAANGAGVGADFRNANQISTAGHTFIRDVLSKAVTSNNAIAESINPEDAARALLQLQGSDMQKMRLLMPDATNALAAAKLRQMQQARPSQAGATGAETSTETFLTNLNQMRQRQPGTASALFQPAQGHVNDLGTVAADMRQTAKNVNVSRTAENTMIGALWPAAMAGYHFGGPLGAVGAPAGMVGSNWALGHFLTNPGVVRYLAAQRGQLRPEGILGGAVNTVVQPPPLSIGGL